MTVEDIRLIGISIFVLMLFAAAVGALMLIYAFYKVRHLNIPPDASFSETLLYTPFVVVLAIDLLDLGLDILAAPLSWAILDRMGLKALRGVAAAEALIPGTQLIPTLTLCWFGARLLRTGHKVTG